MRKIYLLLVFAIYLGAFVACGEKYHTTPADRHQVIVNTHIEEPEPGPQASPEPYNTARAMQNQMQWQIFSSTLLGYGWSVIEVADENTILMTDGTARLAVRPFITDIVCKVTGYDTNSSISAIQWCDATALDVSYDENNCPADWFIERGPNSVPAALETDVAQAIYKTVETINDKSLYNALVPNEELRAEINRLGFKTLLMYPDDNSVFFALESSDPESDVRHERNLSNGVMRLDITYTPAWDKEPNTDKEDRITARPDHFYGSTVLLARGKEYVIKLDTDNTSFGYIEACGKSIAEFLATIHL